jgi:hypothetical protein
MAGFYMGAVPEDTVHSQGFSLLPPTEKGVFNLAGDNNAFCNNTDSSVWYTVKATIPIERQRVPEEDEDVIWAADATLRPTSTGPLSSVRHEVKYTVDISLELENGEVATAQVAFGVPLQFVEVAEPTPLLTEDQVTRTGLLSRPSCKARLPVYSELYDCEGERKLDPTPLPLYTPRNTDAPPSFESLQPLELSLQSSAVTVKDVQPSDSPLASVTISLPSL